MADYDINFDCPADDELVETLVDAAAAAGAGLTEHYSRVAYLCRGQSTWRSEAGANPHIGTVGEISIVDVVRVSMRCSEAALAAAVAAVRLVHPYEEPFVNVVRLDDASV